MWKFNLLHVVKTLSACMAFLFGMLILQGCGEVAPEPYAELDKAFPNGRPAVSSPDERAQDAAYNAQMKAMGEKTAALTKALSTAEYRFNTYVSATRKSDRNRFGERFDDELFQVELERRGAYQALKKKLDAARAALDTHLAEVRKTISSRMSRDRDRYDAMFDAASKAAEAAGLPIRRVEVAPVPVGSRPPPTTAPAVSANPGNAP